MGAASTKDRVRGRTPDRLKSLFIGFMVLLSFQRVRKGSRMIRSVSRVLRLSALLLASAAPAIAAVEDGAGGTILLTFDLEERGDAEALAGLDLPVRATYFFTGDYGRAHPELVRSLAREGNTIGSHSFFHKNMTTLDPLERELDIQLSRVTLQALSCVPVRWFRPPFLEYDEATMKEVAEAGFAYSSADKDLWPRNPAVSELPIATHDGELVSDWDIFNARPNDEAAALQFLIDAFEAHREAGRPFVVLLHPRIIGSRPAVLRSFLDWAQAEGARFLTANDLVTEKTYPLPNRIGLWLDRNPVGEDARRVASEALRLGITDLVVPLYPAGPGVSGLPAPGTAVDPALAELRLSGVRVLGAMRLLRQPELLAKRPDLAMRNAFGRRSTDWASPSNPEVWEHVIATARELGRDPSLDGLLLTDVRYPDLSLDHSAAAYASFSQSSGLQVRTADDLLGRYPEWARWRAGELADLVDAIVQAAKGDRGPDFVVGVSFPSDAVVSYRAVEATGQDLLRLAPLLDLTVMTVASEELAREPGVLARSEIGIGARTGNTETMMAVTPRLVDVGANQTSAVSVRATVLFGTSADRSSLPLPRALQLLPERATTQVELAWMTVPERCSDLAPAPPQ